MRSVLGVDYEMPRGDLFEGLRDVMDTQLSGELLTGVDQFLEPKYINIEEITIVHYLRHPIGLMSELKRHPQRLPLDLVVTEAPRTIW